MDVRACKTMLVWSAITFASLQGDTKHTTDPTVRHFEPNLFRSAFPVLRSATAPNARKQTRAVRTILEHRPAEGRLCHET